MTDQENEQRLQDLRDAYGEKAISLIVNLALNPFERVLIGGLSNPFAEARYTLDVFIRAIVQDELKKVKEEITNAMGHPGA